MKNIPFDHLVEAVARLAVETNRRLPDDVLASLIAAREREETEPARTILDQIVRNARIAVEDDVPLCQDTGTAVFFVDGGEDARVGAPGIDAALQEGVRRGYREGLLRMSMVCDPLRRRNTGDNTPAIIHYRPVPGNQLRIWFCPKGGGAENMSALSMLTPGEGRDGVMRFVTSVVQNGGGKPCPPLFVGVGIGGNFEYSAELAKRSLFRNIGERNSDPYYAEMEVELRERINALDIGPMGLGGKTTALEVCIESAPCHIASLPVAVNIQCHSTRHGYLEL